MSRKVHLEDGCTLRFPGRSDDFADGVELGILAAQMDHGVVCLSRRIARSNLDQLRALAAKLGYRLVVGVTDDSWCHVDLVAKTERPRLRLVHPADSARAG
ncbi:MAG: hypothetical protein SFW09_11345 [Hyphomicrobiaceae bacterium]|nr:hypothetical protein [Hyphomicrobiaceae bacterium]